jgi:hypothetical protein
MSRDPVVHFEIPNTKLTTPPGIPIVAQIGQSINCLLIEDTSVSWSILLKLLHQFRRRDTLAHNGELDVTSDDTT